jgi:hypothetical protein
MQLSSKQKITLGALVGYLFAVVADPFITIARLNVEGWAKENGYDKLYKLASQPPEWLVTFWDTITGSFGLGFILGGLLFAFWDPLARYGARLVTTKEQARQALDDLFADGVRQRNRLLQPLQEYDDAAEREMLGDWSDRVVRKLDDANVPVGPKSRFRTLNLFQPKHAAVAGRGADQVKLEAIWNEKLDRLQKIIDGL